MENNDNDDKSKEGKTDDEKSELNEEGEEEEIKVVQINDKIRYKSPAAILPSILDYLISERKVVKNMQKVEKDQFKNSLLNIKQKSLKISVNSLYGYLGYKAAVFILKKYQH